MLNTYKAVLRDNVLEWQSDAPPQLAKGRAVAVHVTLLEEPQTLVEFEVEREERARQMVEALEAIAQRGSLAGFDASSWQREIRKDRPLPGRAEEDDESGQQLNQ